MRPHTTPLRRSAVSKVARGNRFRVTWSGALICAVGVLALLVMAVSGNASAQSAPVAPKARPPASDQSSTAIGDSGYRVPIPEIRMRRIIGDRPPAKAPAEPEEEPPAPAPPIEEPVTPPKDRRIEPGPAPPLPERPTADRLPFEPPPVVERERPLPTRGPVKEGPVKEPPAVVAPKEEPLQVLRPPAVPEVLTESLPQPKKHVLRKGPELKIPPLLAIEPAKVTPPKLGLKPASSSNQLDRSQWIPLATRQDPLVIPAAEPEPAPVAALPAPHEPSRISALEPEPGPAAVPTPEPPAPPPPRETPPVVETPPVAEPPVPMIPPALETPPPGETPPPVETPPAAETPPVEEPPAPREAPEPVTPAPPPPVRELVASPLQDDTLTSREVKDYLRETAPILEELSLLMTRTPALTVADFDPSDPNAPIIPRDVYLKMESIKRDLQVLDAKTFAIIPPPRYVKFHELIRQSIAQTHQACDAIINYFAESKPENLQKVQQHLSKARELIQRTRERAG